MRSFSPIWHPAYTNDYFILFNNVNKTNNILYYDSDNKFIEYPKIFTYERMSGDFTIKKILTNEASDDPIFEPKLPSSNGIFTINKLIPDEGKGLPTIDIYVGVPFQIECSWNSDSPSNVGHSSYNASCNDTYPPTNNTIIVSWNFGDHFQKNGWKYIGDRITITTGWGVEKQSNEANSSITISSPPNSFTGEPTITVSCYVLSSYEESYQPWDGIVKGVGELGLIVRSNPGGGAQVGSLYDGDKVHVIGQQGQGDQAWYNIGSGWVLGIYIERI